MSGLRAGLSQVPGGCWGWDRCAQGARKKVPARATTFPTGCPSAGDIQSGWARPQLLAVPSHIRLGTWLFVTVGRRGLAPPHDLAGVCREGHGLYPPRAPACTQRHSTTTQGFWPVQPAPGRPWAEGRPRVPRGCVGGPQSPLGGEGPSCGFPGEVFAKGSMGARAGHLDLESRPAPFPSPRPSPLPPRPPPQTELLAQAEPGWQEHVRLRPLSWSLLATVPGSTPGGGLTSGAPSFPVPTSTSEPPHLPAGPYRAGGEGFAVPFEGAVSRTLSGGDTGAQRGVGHVPGNGEGGGGTWLRVFREGGMGC